MQQMSRRTLAPKFSEGARLLWIAIEALGMTQAGAARALGMPSGQLSKLLYGERKPGREWAGKLSNGLKIPTTAWDDEPAVPFDPPAARATDAAPPSARVAAKRAPKKPPRPAARATKRIAKRRPTQRPQAA